MEDINTTDLYTSDSFAEKSAEEKAAELFSKPVEVISITFCIVGLIANFFSVTATAHIPRGQSTHSKLIISLGVSDSLIQAALILHSTLLIFSTWDDCTKMIKRLLLDIALLATLINLLVMAVDHYLAIVKPLQYRRFMSNFRGNCFIIFIWVFSVATGLLELIVGLVKKTQVELPFCAVISSDEFDMELIIIGFIFVVLLVIVVIYTRIYILVKRLMVRDRMMYKDEMHGYKAIITTMLIIGTFTLFWAPNGVFQVYMYLKVESDSMFVWMHLDKFILANDILLVILQLNSIADPLIYAIRLRDVQRGYKVIFYKLFPRYRYSINEEEFRQHHLSFSSSCRNTIPTIMHGSVGSPDSVQEFFMDNDTGRAQESSFIADKNENSSKKNENKKCGDNNLKTDNMDTRQINKVCNHDTDVEMDKVNNTSNNKTNNINDFSYARTADETKKSEFHTSETVPLNPVSEPIEQNA